MIFSSSTKKPKIHSSAYVAPTATIGGDVTIGGPLGDQIDNAGGTGDPEHQRVGAFQGLESFLVFSWNRHHTGDRQAAVQTVIRNGIQVDATDGDGIARAAFRA